MKLRYILLAVGSLLLTACSEPEKNEVTGAEPPLLMRKLNPPLLLRERGGGVFGRGGNA